MIGGFVMAVIAGSFIGQAIVGALAEWSSPAVALAAVCVVAPAGGRGRPCGGACPRRPRRGAPHRGRRRGGHAGAPVAGPGGGLPQLRRVLAAAVPAPRRAARRALPPDRRARPARCRPIGLLGLVAAWAHRSRVDRLGQRAPMTGDPDACGLAGLAADPARRRRRSGCSPPATGCSWPATGATCRPASAEVAARARERDRQPALMAFYAAMWTGAAVAPALGAVLDSWTRRRRRGARPPGPSRSSSPPRPSPRRASPSPSSPGAKEHHETRIPRGDRRAREPRAGAPASHAGLLAPVAGAAARVPDRDRPAELRPRLAGRARCSDGTASRASASASA